ncbi:DUF3142 domain-containing protein [Coraliomargarita sp. SDUM461003]|uniref:DUF3142 domain-containing protein n=1 Tax=Thalassobacterium maritimum TaxID=3041265 RepID=A0ABU1AR23_9BACT|nr:DUF3142 domain-containing protein [Coraliomargarita sp. SDUM461003]MDQ8206618.1 DUF3142 domain-containing protein [Coraliomargarita sp. SDUM461003]
MRRFTAVLLIYAALLLSVRAEMSQAAYLWQRAWTPAVSTAVAEQTTALDGLTVLCAEIKLSDSAQPTRVEIVPDWARLQARGLPITLAIRAAVYSGSFQQDQAMTRCLLDTVANSLRRARAAGIEPAAVEIDFDCATRQLEGYAHWLHLIRAQLDGPALSITTLPTWMERSAAFAQLLVPVDHFVLQVHSVQRADRIDSDASLCDPQLAQRWVQQAGQFVKPYHVALPTYAYRLGYAASGELVEVAGENASPVKNPAWSYRVLRAEPEAMAGLVRQLQHARPATCRGVIWYRLPIGQESYNWDPGTWQAVMLGSVASASWQAQARVQADGLVEIELLQASEVAAEPPRAVQLSWRSGEALAWDGQRHYNVRALSEQALLWQWPTRMEAPLLAQGTRWTIGWLRIQDAANLQITILNDDDD